MTSSLTDRLKAQAQDLGFADVAVTGPDRVHEAGIRLRDSIATGHHGEMTWLADRLHWRSDPSVLWPEARSVVMLADAYGNGTDPMQALEAQSNASISAYAQGRDYHDHVKKRLKRLGRWLLAEAGGEIKVFTDTAPVMEKPLAQAAGLGWQGKHTNLVSRTLGSWFFLGAIFTTLDLDLDDPSPDQCGSCRRCLDVCPTAAFVAPYKLDARRCISYLNIELKGPIPRDLRPLMGNRIYGCDDCLAVCPWNKFAQAGADVYAPREGTGAPPLAELLALDDAGFRKRFSGSPIKRIGLARFHRNVLIAMGNSNDRTFLPLLRAKTDHEDPLVRGAAIWALSRLEDAAHYHALMRPDPDPEVALEWELGAQDLAKAAHSKTRVTEAFKTRA